MWLIHLRFLLLLADFYSHIPCGMWRYARSQNRSEAHWISTHTSRVGCDLTLFLSSWHFLKFLLTHPVWDVTRKYWKQTASNGISTHTSRVGCDLIDGCGSFKCGFLLTHPVWDVTHDWRVFVQFYQFLLTHPVWDVTQLFAQLFHYFTISTHTSRVGCDGCPKSGWNPSQNFYSHIPCGMWLLTPPIVSVTVTFLLTHPVWDVTITQLDILHVRQFLLTHPVWDVTEVVSVSIRERRWFLLTHPVWDVTITSLLQVRELRISTHTSRVGCDLYCGCGGSGGTISTHTSRVGCDRYI